MPFDANQGSEESQDNVERSVLHGYAAAARVHFNVKHAPAALVVACDTPFLDPFCGGR
jgi:molybdopterin-guanine dinucleotide biosynthesis protein A